MAEQKDSGIKGIEVVDGQLEVTFPATMEEFMSSVLEPVETPPKLIRLDSDGRPIPPQRPHLKIGENCP